MPDNAIAMLVAIDATVLDSHSGPGINYVDHWWLTDARGRLVFDLQHDRYLPQCHAHAAVRDVYRAQFPRLTCALIPRVFVPDHIHVSMTHPIIAVHAFESDIDRTSITP